MGDRLKAWLDEQLPKGQEAVVYPSDSLKALRALRAVVELHKRGPGYDECGAEGCVNAWPCPTIRAAEKEVFRS